jgi:hypothetical protein
VTWYGAAASASAVETLVTNQTIRVIDGAFISIPLTG